MKRSLVLVFLAGTLALSGCIGSGPPAAVEASAEDTEPSGNSQPDATQSTDDSATAPPARADGQPRNPSPFDASFDPPSPPASAPATRPDPGPGLGGTAPVSELTESIILGQLSDELGQSHALVLNVTPGAKAALAGNPVFGVLSGSTRFAVAGDVRTGGWQFSVDSAATGDDAPIVVVKTASSSVEDLAADRARYTAPALLTEDTLETSSRLTGLIATVLSKAQDDTAYQSLASLLQDPSWNGVLIFNALVTVPADALGQSTEELAGTQLATFTVGFTMSGITGADDSLFAVVDYREGSEPDSRYLQAFFTNSALTRFEMGGDALRGGVYPLSDVSSSVPWTPSVGPQSGKGAFCSESSPASVSGWALTSSIGAVASASVLVDSWSAFSRFVIPPR